MWRNVRVWTAVSDARLLLTCGLPAAGKTTLARQLAADRRALRLTQDEWLIALGSSPWDASTRERVDHELWRLAQEVLRLGLSVVVDFGLWARINTTRCDPWLAALVSVSNCTISTCLLPNSGGGSKRGTWSHPGTATRSPAPTSTSGYASFRLLMLPSWRCSIRRQSQTEPSGVPSLPMRRLTGSRPVPTAAALCRPSALSDEAAGTLATDAEYRPSRRIGDAYELEYRDDSGRASGAVAGEFGRPSHQARILAGSVYLRPPDSGCGITPGYHWTARGRKVNRGEGSGCCSRPQRPG